MAIYHLSVKAISRSEGRSSVACSAYRAGEKLLDERTGEVHDFTKKRGILHQEILSPKDVNLTRSELWNSAEKSENRKNSTVAREYEIALPSELNFNEQKALVQEFSQHLVSTYGVCADIAIHEPNKKGDQRNHHAHILTTTRSVSADGFGAKTRILDDKKTGEIERIREKWAELSNNALERAGHMTEVSHKSLKEQGINREPTQHMGVSATAMERRGLTPERQRTLPKAESEQTKEIKKNIEFLEEITNNMQNVRADGKQWIKQEKERIREEERQQKELELQKLQKQRLERERQRQEHESKRQIEREKEKQNIEQNKGMSL